MTNDELNNEYFEWLCRLVCDTGRYRMSSYRKLLHRLYDIDFTYIIGMDGNQESDGIDLRYRFGREYFYADAMVASCLDIRSCSVLEMMVALAIRCENHIMDDPDVGNRTGLWFWSMITSLGLYSMTDARFDADYVDDVIFRLLNREYERNGTGGLFTIDDYKGDLRSVEIWYQMCWYLDGIIKNEGA